MIDVEFRKEMLECAKKDFDKQLDRFSKIWQQEVLNRKKRTKRGIITERVLVDIYKDIYKDRTYFVSYRTGFDNAYRKEDWVTANRVVNVLKSKLSNYKKVVQRKLSK